MKIHKFFDKSMILFIVVGMVNTLVSILLMFLLEDLGYWPSTAIAYVAGAVLSFFLNRYVTFKSDVKLWHSALKFTINVVVCYLISYSVAQPFVSWMLGFTDIFSIWQERIAKLFGMVLYTLINYFGQRFFAFSEKK